jgi:hypothetical protein
MKAVAIITPDPKYLAMKKANLGTRIRSVLARIMGRRAPMRALVSNWAFFRMKSKSTG